MCDCIRPRLTVICDFFDTVDIHTVSRPSSLVRRRMTTLYCPSYVPSLIDLGKNRMARLDLLLVCCWNSIVNQVARSGTQVRKQRRDVNKKCFPIQQLSPNLSFKIGNYECYFSMNPVKNDCIFKNIKIIRKRTSHLV